MKTKKERPVFRFCVAGGTVSLPEGAEGSVEAQRQELVKRLTESHRALRWDVAAGVAAAAVALWGYAQGNRGMMLAAAVLGLLTVFLLYAWERETRRIELVYELDAEAAERMRLIQEGLRRLRRCSKLVWVQSSRRLTDTMERKRNSGATRGVESASLNAGFTPPVWLGVNIKLPSVSSGRAAVYFLPDGVLLRNKNTFTFADNNQFRLESEEGLFITPGVPWDGEVVDYTWQYVNKKGGRDKRYANNKRIPICRVQNLTLYAHGEEFCEIIASCPKKAEPFAACFEA